MNDTIHPRDFTIEQFDALNDPNMKLAAWQSIAADLKRLKALEAHARVNAITAFFPTMKEGTNNFDLGSGYTLKVVNKFNYSMGANDVVDAALSKIEALGEKGKFIAERIMKFDPRLSVTEYKALDPKDKIDAQIKALIDSVMTIRPGAPEVEIVPPKTK